MNIGIPSFRLEAGSGQESRVSIRLDEESRQKLDRQQQKRPIAKVRERERAKTKAWDLKKNSKRRERDSLSVSLCLSCQLVGFLLSQNPNQLLDERLFSQHHFDLPTKELALVELNWAEQESVILSQDGRDLGLEGWIFSSRKSYKVELVCWIQLTN